MFGFCKPLAIKLDTSYFEKIRPFIICIHPIKCLSATAHVPIPSVQFNHTHSNQSGHEMETWILCRPTVFKAMYALPIDAGWLLISSNQISGEININILIETR